MNDRFVILPHTHWDREWYLSFQDFRWKLVKTVDEVVRTLEGDPGFRHFMLDGQTVVLDDYLELRPEAAPRLKALITAGRLGVGPWYLQPDDLLVSGEALVRNLEKGMKEARTWGKVVEVGHVPDSFGHTGMLPAILSGFGIGAASLMRGPGLALDTNFFQWKSPDGSSVLVVHLIDSYGNGAELTWGKDQTAGELETLAQRQRAAAFPGVPFLVMAGTDHRPISPSIPGAIAGAGLADRVRIDTLASYLDEARPLLPSLPVWTGELRDHGRQPLLVGVTSARSWIKAEDQRVSLALERRAEPLDALARWVARAPGNPEALDRAWTWLLQNQPHDSICGCSIDRVHEDMRYRYAQASDLAALVAADAAAAWAAALDLGFAGTSGVVAALNPGPARTLADLTFQIPDWRAGSWLEDSQGRAYALQAESVTGGGSATIFEERFTPGQVQFALGMVKDGKIPGWSILSARATDEAPGLVRVELDLTEAAFTPFDWAGFVASALPMVKRPGLERVRVVGLRAGMTEVRFRAPLPAFGAEAFVLRSPGDRPGPAAVTAPRPVRVTGRGRKAVLENDTLRVGVAPDGTLRVTNLVTGQVLAGLDRWEDGGDRGDEYNYDRPQGDRLVSRPVRCRVSVAEGGPVRACLRVETLFRIPEGLASDRERRSKTPADLRVTRWVSLSAGARRIEVRAEVRNEARDHRLRITAPGTGPVSEVQAGGSFETVVRSTAPRPWVGGPEEPPVTHPFTGFVTLPSPTGPGLTFLSRGLREYEVDPRTGRLAVTVLRSVGWLSRGDLRSRKDHAGPGLETPGAQERGSHPVLYAWLPWDNGGASREWDDYAVSALTQVVPSTAEPRTGTLQPGVSLVSWDDEGWAWDSFRSVGPGILALRGHDRAGSERPMTLKFARPVTAVWETRLDGTRIAGLPLSSGGTEGRAVLRPRALQTFEVTL